MLFRSLPESVRIGRKTYRINTDFCVFMELERVVVADQLDAVKILRMFYHCIPNDIETAADKLLWFYRCGDDPDIEAHISSATVRGYDFKKDADALYQSFMEAYNIDLYEVRMHWWKFRKLMFGLPANTPLMKLIYWRTTDVSKLSKDERTYVLQKRKQFALQNTGAKITKEERDQAFLEKIRKRREEAESSCRK